jgi:LmbE family N-acetylglucosaminyl deacetylase
MYFDCDAVRQRLTFTARNNSEEKVFHWLCVGDEDVWAEFSSGLRELWPDVKLPSPGRLSFQDSGKGMELLCRKPLVINGVSVRSSILKPGDRIIIGPLRLFFNSVETIEEPESLPSSKTAAAMPLLPAALMAAVLVAAITIGCIAIPGSVERPEQMAMPETYGPKEDSAETMALPASDKLIVIPPGGMVPEFDLDMLFIHAHPDDEALDFGILLALAESAGLKTGLITFTDGGSGLDIYPGRPVTSPYPDYRMAGDELADIRSQELVRAAEVLGIDLVIRLGLENHPYNGVKDRLLPGDVLDNWGGRESLVDLLMDIINKTSPELVAAPDVPGPAREHFEHEAVGSIAAELMNRIKYGGLDGPVKFITCIDPRQIHLYPEASMVDANQKAGEMSLRDIQLRALSMHKTQNDAVNVGTGFLPDFPAEYYQIQYRDERIAFSGLID